MVAAAEEGMSSAAAAVGASDLGRPGPVERDIEQVMVCDH